MKDCVSLDIAKKLKDAGWKQDKQTTCFYVAETLREFDGHVLAAISDHEKGMELVAFAAPNIGKLLEELPKIRDRDLSLYRVDTGEYEAYYIEYVEGDRKMYRNLMGVSVNPADALALLWLELKKKGIV